MALTAARTLYRSSLPGREPVYAGKVREVYDLGDAYLMVASDRLSAFDVVFPTPIPGKGRVLTRVSAHWFGLFGVRIASHFQHLAPTSLLAALGVDPELYEGRSMVVSKCRPLPVECIVRGSLEGSAWAEYSARGTVAGQALPTGLGLHDELPEPLFTPTTKAAQGHDLPVTWDEFRAITGEGRARWLRDHSLEVFHGAKSLLRPSGVTLADAKFEFGEADGELMLIDELLTPDSARFLVAGPDGEPVAMDKQFVRDWCLRSGWDREPPAPVLPPEIVENTSARYRQLARLVTGEDIVP